MLLICPLPNFEEVEKSANFPAAYEVVRLILTLKTSLRWFFCEYRKKGSFESLKHFLVVSFSRVLFIVDFR